MTIRSLLIAVPLLLVSWIATLSIVALATDEAPAYVVLFPPQEFLSALPNGAAIMSASAFSVTLTSEDAGFARTLYQSGAMLVLPAGLPGCLPVPKQL